MTSRTVGSPRPVSRLAGPLLILFGTTGVIGALGPCACGTPDPDADLTGVRVTVHYDPALGVEQLRVVGWMDNAILFGPELLPGSASGTLSPDGESLVILLPESASGESLQLRVDGLAGGQVVGTTGGTVTVLALQIVDVLLTLDGPVLCGDGRVSSEYEDCDDGNLTAGDGCSPDCTVEDGFTCHSSPSECRFRD